MHSWRETVRYVGIKKKLFVSGNYEESSAFFWCIDMIAVGPRIGYFIVVLAVTPP